MTDTEKKELNEKLARLKDERQDFLYQQNRIRETLDDITREIKQVEKLIGDNK